MVTARRHPANAAPPCTRVLGTTPLHGHGQWRRSTRSPSQSWCSTHVLAVPSHPSSPGHPWQGRVLTLTGSRGTLDGWLTNSDAVDVLKENLHTRFVGIPRQKYAARTGTGGRGHGRFRFAFPRRLPSPLPPRHPARRAAGRMARSRARRLLLPVLTFVTLGMVIGSLLQLAFFRRVDDRSHSVHLDNDQEAAVLRLGYVKPEVISWKPRIIVFHNFLSSEECDYLREIARPRLEISTVVDVATGKGVKSDVRTSSGMFVNSEERKRPVIQAIEKRISIFSQIPVENGELIQVLRYEPSQYYRPHHDYFSDTFNLKRGGQRVATMLMYLTDGVEGGETHFPQAGDGECSCGGRMVKGLCVKPNKGDAVLFWSMGLDGNTDLNSLHSGCPVLEGEKWSATKWMRQKMTF
ncbi:hypothetical protein ACQ4PT_010420 [Festuca glaucescens]